MALKIRVHLDPPMFNNRADRQLHPTYRPDIDGLRAIAVLSVIIFHAFPSRLPGGFIGVDIFFVISGFLISTIVFSNLENSNFSILDFYSRRIRRILPSLITVMTASLAFGWFFLLADEYAQLAKHVAGGAAFISNFILWGESGYFDNVAETKPMLHLWSLAIEEQFYIFWPLLLGLVWQRRWNFVRVTAGIAALSFAVNVFLSVKDPTTAFYLPISRFWELMIGGTLAYVSLHKPDLFSHHRNLQSFVGLALLLIGFIFIDKTKSFPGWWALLPSIGAFLIISAGSDSLINKTLLSNKMMVGIGLISYPLYLWHWPLLSYLNIAGGNPSRESKVLAVLAALLLSVFTYKFIEKPVRTFRSNPPAWKLSPQLPLLGLLATLLAVSVLITSENGYAMRELRGPGKQATRNASELKWDSSRTDNCEALLGVPSAFCIVFGNTANIEAAIIGDSTGNALAPGLSEYYADDAAGLINVGSWTCPPIRGVTSSIPGNVTQQYNCAEITQKAYEYILTSKSIRIVFLSIFARDLNTWILPDTPPNATLAEKFDRLQPLIDRDLSDLRKKGLHIVVTYDTPRLPVPASSCLERLPSILRNNSCEVRESQLVDRHPQVDIFDDFFAKRTDVCIFKQSDLLIQEGKVRYFDDEGILLVRDGIHLSYNGSSQMAEIYSRSSCFVP